MINMTKLASSPKNACPRRIRASPQYTVPPESISVGSVVFVGLTVVSNRHTDIQTTLRV